TLPAKDRADLDPRRHRLVRRSVPYGRKLAAGRETWDRVHRGILFASYQADLARPFEHVLSKWLTSPDFPAIPNGVHRGVDPVVGDLPTTPYAPDQFANTVQVSSQSPEVALAYHRYVHARGGAYFFAPSLTVVDALADGR